MNALLDDPMFWAGLYLLTVVALAVLAAYHIWRPRTPSDDYCSAVDDALTDAERAAREQRARARKLAALEAVGDDADRVAWAWADRPHYAPHGHPEFMPDPRRTA